MKIQTLCMFLVPVSLGAVFSREELQNPEIFSNTIARIITHSLHDARIEELRRQLLNDENFRERLAPIVFNSQKYNPEHNTKIFAIIANDQWKKNKFHRAMAAAHILKSASFPLHDHTISDEKLFHIFATHKEKKPLPALREEYKKAVMVLQQKLLG